MSGHRSLLKYIYILRDLELEKEDINQQFNQQFENEFVSDPFEQLRIDEAIQEKLFLD
jgi:hypothetical protein